jgi:hypothetical protein
MPRLRLPAAEMRLSLSAPWYAEALDTTPTLRSTTRIELEGLRSEALYVELRAWLRRYLPMPSPRRRLQLPATAGGLSDLFTHCTCPTAWWRLDWRYAYGNLRARLIYVEVKTWARNLPCVVDMQEEPPRPA